MQAEEFSSEGACQPPTLRAAEYVRMSTEHQQYSTENQADKIREYAARRNIEIVCTYADEGKSGLRIDGRQALQQLIKDVEAGDADFQIILVYDVSRWGRFQDADESAYYEYICRRAGIQVAYCAEQFENDGSPVSTIVKGVKRAMAGEYSRELSAKVFAGQCRLIELGFRQGGPAGYGLRRVLIDQSGTFKGELSRGEHKSLQTDRVILQPGPDDEVAVVNQIYRWFVTDNLTELDIAERLNTQGTRTDLGRDWTRATVREVLSNEKYIGNNVYNRRSFKLKKHRVVNSPDMWIKKEGAFEGIVPPDLFYTAQGILRARAHRYSDEELIEKLRNLYLDKAKDALRDMSKWLQDKQMTAFEVTYQGKTKTLQEWSKGVSMRDKLRLGPDERANFRDIVNVTSGLALGTHFTDLAPEYPTFSVLVTESNRKQLITNALKALAGGTRTKDAIAILDALEMLDGDRIEPTRSKYAQEVLNRLKAKGHGQVLNRSELVSGATDVEYFAPVRFRIEPDLLVAVLGSLVYSGDVVLAITGDKIDSGKVSLLVERALDELKQFKHVEAPKEINVAVLRSLFELLGLPSGLAQMATQGKEEPVKELLDAVAKQVQRILSMGTDLQSRLSFWGQSLLREEELRDWRTRLEALKGFMEGLAPYNTVGKLKNLRITQEDIDAQKKNLDVLASVEKLRDLVAELGTTAAYLSQAEMVLAADHPWAQQAQAARKEILDKLAEDRNAQQAADYRQRLATLKKDYIAAYVAQHSKARLGIAEDKTKSSLRKDSRVVTLRALAGISLMPTGQLTTFEDKLDKLKSCASLVESELAAGPVCPHCGFRPANEQGDLLPAANVLKTLDDELDRLLDGWKQTLLDNLDDPIIQANFELLKAAQRDLIKGFLASKALPDPVTPDFVSAVQEALSGLEKILVTGDDIKKALLSGGSPATPDDLRKRFESLLNERCKGKDAGKLRFVIE